MLVSDEEAALLWTFAKDGVLILVLVDVGLGQREPLPKRCHVRS